jgi:hypothetical protein
LATVTAQLFTTAFIFLLPLLLMKHGVCRSDAPDDRRVFELIDRSTTDEPDNYHTYIIPLPLPLRDIILSFIFTHDGSVDDAATGTRVEGKVTCPGGTNKSYEWVFTPSQPLLHNSIYYVSTTNVFI